MAPRPPLDELLELLTMMRSVLTQGPLELFWEPWQDEVVGIDPTYWATAVGGTGTVTRDATEAGVLKVLLNCPAGADTARLTSVARWRCDPTNFRTNSIVRKLVHQFRFKVANLANFSNTVSIIGGLTPGVASTRGSNDIAAFILAGAGNALSALIDLGGVETVTDLSAGLNLAHWLLAKIEVYRDGANDTIRFTVTDAAGVSNVATHIANIPIQSMYLQHYCVSLAAVACSLHVGELEAAYYDNTAI